MGRKQEKSVKVSQVSIIELTLPGSLGAPVEGLHRHQSELRRAEGPEHLARCGRLPETVR